MKLQGISDGEFEINSEAKQMLNARQAIDKIDRPLKGTHGMTLRLMIPIFVASVLVLGSAWYIIPEKVKNLATQEAVLASKKPCLNSKTCAPTIPAMS